MEYLPLQTLLNKENVSKYGEIGKILGSGTYGNVSIRGNVAVKKMMKERFSATVLREISILLNLHYINIVKIYDIFDD
jgi:serine/threonine protein kinase